MGNAYHHRKKIILRPARTRIDVVCEKVVRQLALHLLLNKSRMSWCAHSDEIELAINRLIRLDLVKAISIQIDEYNMVDYYFLKSHADLVQALLNRYTAAIEQARLELTTPHTAPPIPTYEPEPVTLQQAPEDIQYISLRDFLKH